MKTIIKVQGSLPWEVARSRCSSRWIGTCDALGLVIEGESLDDLFECINESIQLMMTSLLEDGEMDQFLRARGWTTINEQHQDGEPQFEVPLELKFKQGNGSARNVYQ